MAVDVLHMNAVELPDFSSCHSSAPQDLAAEDLWLDHVNQLREDLTRMPWWGRGARGAGGKGRYGEGREGRGDAACEGREPGK